MKPPTGKEQAALRERFREWSASRSAVTNMSFRQVMKARAEAAKRRKANEETKAKV